ncbi:hypothetical protein AMQ83_29190 [Paenibacillus riograndensis]|nr:hypothetical protein AMQ83_29190 [Paenibacillus riograndensis]
MLIIDDEQLVRKGLQMTVDWNRHGMIVVDDAPNGALGWEKVVRHEPDVVITDIVMPEMNGIELAHKIRKAYPNVKILFLSCHRDFAYAQQGIQIGVSDYIVKTSMDEEEVGRCLDKIRSECQSALAEQPPQAPAADEGRLVSDWLQRQDVSSSSQLSSKLEKEWKWMTRQGCIIHLYDNGSANKNSEPEADEARLPGAEPGWELYRKIAQLLATGSPSRGFWACPDGSALLVCTWAERDLAEHELLNIKIARIPGLEWRAEGPVEGSAHWTEGVMRLMRLRKIECGTPLSGRQHKEDIYRAIDYINRHLHLDPRAGEIADRIGVSRSYFSTVFKEATGRSLIDFISQKKLERAQSLLELTEYRIEEIAEKAGIGDVKYFAKWFKKCTGLAPGQYRQQTKRH